ncbi:hypothetical protein BJ085DRAFT_31374 [Dimargaris cristalligena]|uniref:Xylanolytic transcriptional activator regulatory domain-containing protein n=1 Tax=Dimargaris cristalligena TaxID=215637 RepID=A0A4P9ZUE6_9FUNG|nr:hypothetical protein BJ085DRAFT_31374 [Dimargaris cristalligena]|eukprot:RKP36412.1 hypothetical protein BJ085DRAFT_31374 [Dimargaris cristalligena]
MARHPFAARVEHLVEHYALTFRSSAMELCNYPSTDLMVAIFLFGVYEYGRGKMVSSNMYFDMTLRLGRTLKVLQRDEEQKYCGRSASSVRHSTLLTLGDHIRVECLRRAWYFALLADSVESFTFDHRPKFHPEEIMVALPCPSRDWDRDCYALPDEVTFSVLTAHHGHDSSWLNHQIKLLTIAQRVAHFKADLAVGRIARLTPLHPEYQAIEALFQTWESALPTIFPHYEQRVASHLLPAYFFLKLFYYAIRILFYRAICEPSARHRAPPLLSPPADYTPVDAGKTPVTPSFYTELSKTAWSQCLQIAALSARCLLLHGREVRPADHHPLIGFSLWHSGTVLIQQKARTSRPDEMAALQQDIDIHYFYLRKSADVWHRDIYERMKQLDCPTPGTSPLIPVAPVGCPRISLSPTTPSLPPAGKQGPELSEPVHPAQAVGSGVTKEPTISLGE